MDFETLNRLAAILKSNLEAQLAEDASGRSKLPSRAVIEKICHHYVDTLFALFHYSGNGNPHFVRSQVSVYLKDIKALLVKQICHAVRLESHTRGKPLPQGADEAREQVEALFEQVPEAARLLASDIDAAFSNDPAAAGYEEVLLTYPGIQTITVQRLAHRLYLLDVPIIPRIMTETAHSHTGIDIHPGASIGESFFIDHGTGVVIGETATIGSKVTLYHGVTLGAFNPLARDEHAHLRRGRENKRHPDLEDHVTIYPNATILGGNTRIGHHSIIGGNVWLTHSVAPYSRVVLKEPELVIRDRRASHPGSGGEAVGE